MSSYGEEVHQVLAKVGLTCLLCRRNSSDTSKGRSNVSSYAEEIHQILAKVGLTCLLMAK